MGGRSVNSLDGGPARGGSEGSSIGGGGSASAAPGQGDQNGNPSFDSRRQAPKLKQPGRRVPLWGAMLISAGFSILFGLIAFFAAVAVTSNRPAETVVEQRKEVISAEGELFNKISSEVGQSVVSIIVDDGSGNQAAGTGFLIDSSGLIITNKHVVGSAASGVTVIDFKNREYAASIVGRDTANDIAFIKVPNLGEGVKPAKLADSSSVRVGDKVLAIGNALGEFQNSVTSGIISGIGRPVDVGDEQNYESLFNLIQTDAAINPGNSGGPLVNMSGEVVGINTAVAQDAEGIGFSIPINDAKSLIAEIEDGGSLAQRPYLGVQYVDVTEDIASKLSLSVDSGALIYAYGDDPVEAGSPAKAAGLQEYDVITSVGSYTVGKDLSLAGALAKFKPGETVAVKIIRGGAAKTVSVTLGSR